MCALPIEPLLVKRKKAYELRISDWSSDVCSSDLPRALLPTGPRLTRLQEADVDHVALDDTADRRQQRRHVAALHPGAAARIEHGLQLLDHEGDVAAAAEHRGDHARQRQRTGERKSAV